MDSKIRPRSNFMNRVDVTNDSRDKYEVGPSLGTGAGSVCVCGLGDRAVAPLRRSARPAAPHCLSLNGRVCGARDAVSVPRAYAPAPAAARTIITMTVFRSRTRVLLT